MASSKKAIFTSCLLFTLYGIALLLVLVYYKFPYTDFVDYLSTKFGRNIPYEIQVSDIEPLTPPVGISLRDVAIFNPPRNDRERERLASIDTLVLKPSLGALAFGNLETGFDAAMFGGDVKGFAENISDSASAQKVEASFQAVDLKRIEAAKALWGLDVTGSADGAVSFSCADLKWWTGTGTLEFSVRNGSISGLRRFLIPLNKVDQCVLDADLAITDGKVAIKKASLNSAQAKMDIIGSAKLAQIPDQTNLDLTVTIEMSALGKREGRLPFDRVRVAIKGTPARPKVRMLPNR